MKREPDIRTLARIVRDLEQDRRDLFHEIPFGSELDASRYDLGRLAVPIVAVVGRFNAGKTSLINTMLGHAALLPVDATPTTHLPVWIRDGDQRRCRLAIGDKTEEREVSDDELRELITSRESPARFLVLTTPEARRTPWAWLDMPGTDVDEARAAPFNAHPTQLADLCLLTTPATQALSLRDLRQLMMLSDVFPADRLALVVTRIDQVQDSQLASIKAHVRAEVGEALPERKLPIFYVSAQTSAGVAELAEHLSSTIYSLQEHWLGQELTRYKKLLDDLKRVLTMRELATVKPETVRTIRDSLVGMLVDEMLTLKRNLPQYYEESARAVERTLPKKARPALVAYQQQLEARLKVAAQGIGERLNETLLACLRRDLPSAVSQARLADGFSSLFSLCQPEYFDDETAARAAVGGAGLGAIVGAALGPIGWAVAAIALAGGVAGAVFGGEIGEGEIIGAAQFRPLIGRVNIGIPVDAAAESAQAEIEEYCKLLAHVVRIFSSSAHRERDMRQMTMALKAADLRRRKLIDRRDEVQRTVALMDAKRAR